jgi:hypothetical protein
MGLVCRRAVGAAIAALMAGCLVPQDVDPINTRKHLPPRIVIESIQTELISPFLTLVRAPRDVGCRCTLDLAIPSVAEDDPTVELVARWFVDYDPQVRASWGYVTSPLHGSFDFTKTVRALDPYTIDADTLGLADGFHTIDVFVAETNAFHDDAANPPLPNRTLFPDYAAATYRFFVKVVTDPDIPQCPQTRILNRFCTGGGP